MQIASRRPQCAAGFQLHPRDSLPAPRNSVYVVGVHVPEQSGSYGANRYHESWMEKNLKGV